MKTNSIYEALNNVDDKFVSEAAKVRGKRPIALMITAASLAAALALAVGIHNLVGRSGITYVAPGFGESKTSSTNDSVYDPNNKFVIKVDDEDYYFNVYPQKIIIPESFMPDDIRDGQFFFDVDMSPTEIFAEFGIHPLMNDNFTDSKNEPGWIENAITGEKFYYNGGPGVSVSDRYISFDYYLYNKTINKKVGFTLDYYTDLVDFSGSYGGEVIYMKDGSVGIICRNRATFAYHGAMYSVTVCTKDFDENIYIMDVLTDLGVL